jgi:hypothetical protein
MKCLEGSIAWNRRAERLQQLLLQRWGLVYHNDDLQTIGCWWRTKASCDAHAPPMAAACRRSMMFNSYRICFRAQFSCAISSSGRLPREQA